MSQQYTAVIVGTDGSPTAAGAVRAAVAVAKALGVPMTIATAFHRGMFDHPPAAILAEFPDGFASGQEAPWARDCTTDAAGVARGAGVAEVHQVTPVGGAAESLMELGDEQPQALIVVGTRGLSDRGERLVGNIPHVLTHHAHNDLLLVGSGRESWASVGLATDGSDTAIEACRHGLGLAEGLGAQATLVTITSDEAMGHTVIQQTATAIGAPDLAHNVVVASRHLGDELSRVAEGYDLLAIGNKGMSGVARILGSVANSVTHHVPTDLLLVNTTRRTKR